MKGFAALSSRERSQIHEGSRKGRHAHLKEQPRFHGKKLNRNGRSGMILIPYVIGHIGRIWSSATIAISHSLLTNGSCLPPALLMVITMFRARLGIKNRWWLRSSRTLGNCSGWVCQDFASHRKEQAVPGCRLSAGQIDPRKQMNIKWKEALAHKLKEKDRRTENTC